MKLEKKVYESRAEKWKDFAIGVGVFFGLNAVFLLLIMLAQTLFYGWEWPLDLTVLFDADPTSSLILIGLFLVQLLANVIVWVYFSLTRPLIALGMIAPLGLLVVLACILGIIASAVCFTSGGY